MRAILPERVEPDGLDRRVETCFHKKSFWPWALGAKGDHLMLNLRLYMAQRLSALVMVPLTIGHILVMIYAVQGGLSVNEILGRTQGSVSWFLFYGSFVLAVAIHAAIGVRVISYEWARLRGWYLDCVAWLVFGLLSWLGGRAVFSVTLAGGGL